MAALFGEEAQAEGAKAAGRLVAVERLHPGRFQPRRRFDEEAVEALAESVRAKGILQPILVRRHPERPQDYEIVAGERRWRAAQRAQLHEVPIILREMEDAEALEIAILENVQRQDLTALEEAEGYRRLLEEFGHTQERLAKSLGKSRSHIANTLRLLGLPSRVKELLDEGSLTAGHARALLTAPDPRVLAEKVVRLGLNVRQTERLAQAPAGRQRPGSEKRHALKDVNTIALERDLSALLGLRVSIEMGGPSGAGTLSIHYKSLEQLDEVLLRLNRSAAGHGR